MKVMAMLGLALLVCVPSARAASITINDDAVFTVTWADTSFSPDLRARATFIVTDFSDTGFNLAITDIRNQTALSPDIDARLVSFGFGLTPDATSFTNVDDGDIYSWGFTNFPSFQQVDICGYSGNNCAGNAFTGLNQGESTSLLDVMSIRINGDFSDGVTFSPIPVRFQTALGSSTFDGTTNDPPDDDPPDDDPPPAPVPEPGTMILVGSGIAALIARRRMRHDRTL